MHNVMMVACRDELLKIAMSGHTMLAAGRKASGNAFRAQEAARKSIRKVPRPSSSALVTGAPKKVPRPMGAVSRKAPPPPSARVKPGIQPPPKKKPPINWMTGGGAYNFSSK